MGYSEALQCQFDMIKFWASENGLDMAHYIATSKYSIGDLGSMNSWKIQALMGEMLSQAETYFISSSIVELLESMQDTFPVCAIHPEDLQTGAGFVYFERPFFLPMQRRLLSEKHEDRGSYRPFRCLLWSNGYLPDAKGFMFHTFIDAPPYSKRGAAATVPQHTQISMVPYGRAWNDDETLDGMVSQLDIEKREQMMGIHAEDAVLLGQESQRLLCLLMHFLRQPFVSTRKERADRATRRRIEIEGKKGRSEVKAESPIRIIILRRSEQAPGESKEEREIEWQFQWFVKGHWRKQYCPSLGPARLSSGEMNPVSHKPVYIHPYLKGPEDAPLKPPKERVFSVIR